MDILQVPSIAGLQAKLSRAQGRRDSLLQRLQDIRREILDLKEEESLLDHVEALFRGLIDAEISEAVKAVEDLQTEALRAVFTDQDLSVRADVSTERGKIAVSLVTTQTEGDGSVTEGGCNESFGGSVTTVESVLLRLLVMLRRGLRPVLVLDEALPAFDPNYATNMGQFLMSLCDRLGVDILMVTHNPMFFESAHRAYRIRRHQDSVRFDLVSEVQR
jgi:hypothetical protein